MNRHTERAENADAPVADFVAKSLDHDRAVIGDDTSCLRLFLEVQQHVVRGQRVEPVVGHQLWQGGLRGRGRSRERPGLALKGTQRATEFQRPSRPVAMPERHLARLARRGRDDDPLERDVLDTPCAGTQNERLARPTLVDHLLIQLAHPRAIGQEHPEGSTIGDGATAHDGQPLAAVAGTQRTRDAVPHQSRAQLVELLAGVAAREQVEHIGQ